MNNKIYSMFALCILFAIPYTVQAQTAYCPADLNLDRFVNSADIGKILLDFGHCSGCSSDLNQDEVVNSADVGIALLYFGACPDDNGGSDCPPYRTFKQKHHFDKECNGFLVGYQYYDELYTGNGQLPDCQSFKTNYKSECFQDQTLIGTIGNLDYFADGNCGCYFRPVENPPICPAYATIAAINWEFPIVVTPVEGNCGQSFQVGLGAIIKYHDGNCNTFWAATYYKLWWWYENGYRIGGCGEYTFYSNGNGGYYSERNCEPYGTLISSSLEPIIADGWTVGTATINVYADGNCGTYNQNTGNEYLPYGTLLGSDSTYNYYSDGAGWYYKELIEDGCDSNGTFISSSSEPIIAGGWTVGTATINVYADGNCGTYQDSSNSYLSYGTFLGSDGTYNYYSDGSGGYYTELIGGGCDSNGTFISSSSEPIIAGGWTVGTTTINVYADGNCGTYQDSSNSYLSYGTFLGSDGTYNYYSDGSGGYYAQLTYYKIVRFTPVPHQTLLHKKNTYITYISLPVPFQTKPIK